MPVFTRDDVDVLFVHVPKTGGTAIERAVAASDWQTSYLSASKRQRELNRFRRCSPQHMHAVLLRELFALDRFAMRFLVVREPIARFRSEYTYRHRRAEAPPTAAGVEAWGLRVLDRFAADPYLFDNHLRPQHEFVVEDALVVRFEDGLDRLWDRLRSEHGLALPASLEARNTSRAPSAEVPVSERLEAALRDFYARDVELWASLG